MANVKSKTLAAGCLRYALVEPLEPRQLLAGDLFAPQQSIPTGLTAGNVIETATADLRNDGNTDLVVLQQNNTVNVLLGNGDGTFQAPETIDVTGTVLSMAVGDINGDGIPDLAVSTFNSDSNSGVIFIYTGKGDGTFNAPQSVAADSNAVSLHIADVNGDKRPDLIYANGATVGVQLQKADGTFAAEVTYVGGSETVATGGDTGAIAVGDLGNGQMDIVTTNHMFYSGADSVAVLMGNGDGTFVDPTVYGVDAAGPAYVTLADLNGDGKLDIIDLNDGQSTANSVNGDIDVLLNNGTGTFANAVGYGGTPDDLAVADMTGDGHLDLVTSNGGMINVSVGNGDGTFQGAISTPEGPVADADTGLVAADFNKDGHTDAILFSRDGTSITELLNTGAQQVTVTTPTVTFAASATTVAAGSPVTLTAVVTPPTAGLAAPTGTITFTININYTGDTTLGTATLTPNGDGTSTATLTTSSLVVGNAYIYDSYGGDANYNPAAGSGTNITVQSSSHFSSVTAALGKVVVPTTTVVAGTKIKYAVPVTVIDSGALLTDEYTFSLFANTANTLDGNQIQISSVPKFLVLRNKQHAVFNFKPVPLPSTLASGNYYLIAEATNSAGSSTVLATTQTIQVAAPAPSISAMIALGKPLSLKVGKTGTITVALTNTGNVDLASSLNIILSASTDGVSPDAGGSLATLIKNVVKIKVGKSEKFSLHFKYTAGMTPGAYFPYVSAIVSPDISATAIGTVQFTLL